MTDRGGRLDYEISVDAEATQNKTLSRHLKGIRQTHLNKLLNKRVNAEVNTGDIALTGDGSYQTEPGKTCNATNVMPVYHSVSHFAENHYFSSTCVVPLNTRSKKIMIDNARKKASRYSNHIGRTKLASTSWSWWALCLSIHVLKTAAQGKCSLSTV